MKTFLINYNLKNSHENYTQFENAIKKLAPAEYCKRCLESTWIVKVTIDAQSIVQHLKKFIEQDDDLLVVKLSDDIDSYGLEDDVADWINYNLHKS